jgi:serine/threonine protein kinase
LGSDGEIDLELEAFGLILNEELQIHEDPCIS